MTYARKLAFAVALIALAVSAAAQEPATPQIADRFFPAPLESIATPASPGIVPLPVESPLLLTAAPSLPSPHKFFDRQQLLALYVHSGVRLADTIKTCRSNRMVERKIGFPRNHVPASRHGKPVRWV